MKSFLNRNQAQKAYERAKPYIMATSRNIVDISVEVIICLFDALKTLIVRARQEPFIFLAAIATIIYAIFTYRQWIVMSGQLNEMRAEQRPWIITCPAQTGCQPDQLS